MKRLLALGILLLFTASGHAQSSGKVLTTCSNLAKAYTAGSTSPITIDINGQLCIAGTISASLVGSTSNASSGVATTATNVPTVSYMYGFNGTTWDQVVEKAGNTAAVSDKAVVVADPNVLLAVQAQIPACTSTPCNVIGSISADPCSSLAKSNAPVSQTTSTQVITGSATKKTFICSILLMASPSETINIIEGTGSVCATSPAAVIGSTVALSGGSIIAQGGLTYGSGSGTVAPAGASTADNVCLQQLSTSRVWGNISYVQQ